MAAAILRHLGGRGVYVESAGVRAGEPDPFVAIVMEEIGIDVTKHTPHTSGERQFEYIAGLVAKSRESIPRVGRLEVVEIDRFGHG
jgi:protein-tyrosine-phosphatase